MTEDPDGAEGTPDTDPRHIDPAGDLADAVESGDLDLELDDEQDPEDLREFLRRAEAGEKRPRQTRVEDFRLLPQREGPVARAPRAHGKRRAGHRDEGERPAGAEPALHPFAEVPRHRRGASALGRIELGRTVQSGLPLDTGTCHLTEPWRSRS